MKRKDFDWLTDEFMLYCRSTQLSRDTPPGVSVSTLRTPGDGCPYASFPCFAIIHFCGLLSMYSQVLS